MEEIVITCNACAAQKTISHVEDSTLSDADVISQAGHTPQCKLKGATNVTVEREARPDEPHVSLYTVKEQASDSSYDEPKATYPETMEVVN